MHNELNNQLRKVNYLNENKGYAIMINDFQRNGIPLFFYVY